MEDLKKLLAAEADYKMEPETMERFLGLMDESLVLREGGVIVPYGKSDACVYVVRSGIIRAAYLDGEREMTFAFGLPGTVVTSYHSFYRREPSFFQLEACCDNTVVMRIQRDRFTELTRTSHDFAQWFMWVSVAQLWFYEIKLAVVNGDANERFESLMKNRPEIIEKVASKTIASYIGITPQYLSKLKRRYLTGGR